MMSWCTSEDACLHAYCVHTDTPNWKPANKTISLHKYWFLCAHLAESFYFSGMQFVILDNREIEIPLFNANSFDTICSAYCATMLKLILQLITSLLGAMCSSSIWNSQWNNYNTITKVSIVWSVFHHAACIKPEGQVLNLSSSQHFSNDLFELLQPLRQDEQKIQEAVKHIRNNRS